MPVQLFLRLFLQQLSKNLQKFHTLAQIIFILLIHANKCFLTLKLLLPSSLLLHLFYYFYFYLRNSIQIANCASIIPSTILISSVFRNLSSSSPSSLFPPIFFNYLLFIYLLNCMMSRDISLPPALCVCVLYPRHRGDEMELLTFL